MRHRGWVVAVFAVGLTACAPKRPGTTGAGPRDYYPDRRDRHANVVLFPVEGKCKVIAGPETHIAFPGKKVIWRVINLCRGETDIELIFERSDPQDAPANPFVESGEKIFSVRVSPGFAAANTFSRTVRDAAAFRGRPTRYFYEVGIRDDPGSRLEPEMDIWP